MAYYVDWKKYYFQHLKNMYGLFGDILEQHELKIFPKPNLYGINEIGGNYGTITFDRFCRMIYAQSSKNIDE